MSRFILITVICFIVSPSFGQWQQTSAPEAGEVYALAQIANTIWAGTTGGLYTSSDNGSTWSLSKIVPDENPVLAIQQNGNEILMVVGQIDSGYDSWNYLLYRSTNFGQDWVIKPLPNFSYSIETDVLVERSGNSLYLKTYGNYYFSDDNGTNWTSIIFPKNPGIVAISGDNIVMANYLLLYISKNKGDSWSLLDSIGTQRPIFFEDSLIIYTSYGDSLNISNDLGASWAKLPFPFTNNYCILMKFKRGISGKIYGFGYGDIIFSADNGISWSLITGSKDISQITDITEDGGNIIVSTKTGIFIYNTSNNQWSSSNTGLNASNVYRLFASPKGELFCQTTNGGFRSPNGGLNWFKFSLGLEQYPIYDMEFIGDTIYASTDNGVYMSTGGDFAPLLPIVGEYDNYSIRYNNGNLYKANNQGIFYTSNGGIDWNQLNTPTNIYEWDDIIFVNGNILIVGNQGEGYISIDNGENWTNVLNVWSPGAGHKNDFYKFGSNLYIADNNDFWVSSDVGFVWNSIIPEGLPLTGGSFPEQLLPYSIAGIGNLLFATVRHHGVFLSNDSGLNWQAVNDGLGNLRTKSSVIADGVLYVGTTNGGVWRRGGKFKSVTGMVYEDKNNNGIKEVDEKPMQQVIVKTTPLNSYTSTLLDGTYFIYGEAFNDTLKIVPPSKYSTVNPTHYLIQDSGFGKDFGIHFTPDINDLCITMTSLQAFRPGFPNEIVLTVKNVGTTTQNVIASLILPNKLFYTSSTPANLNIIGDSIIWDLGQMQPFETRTIIANVLLGTDAIIGEELTLKASVSPVNEDKDLANNYEILNDLIVGSFDPNDKNVEPRDFLTEVQLATGVPLKYTIRFQNTGNYYAENVRILDTISLNLDLSTIKILSSSHPVEWFVRNGNLLEFVFSNIFLPDSTQNEPGSHGFIKFSILPKKGLKIGQTIDNIADIYFDFNAPIKTNTASLLLSNDTATFDLENTLPIIINPNPSRGDFTINLSEPIVQQGFIDVFDSQGRKVHSQVMSEGLQKMTLSIKLLQTGSYFVTVKSGDKFYIGKVIIQH